MHKTTAYCMKGVCQLWTVEAQGPPDQPWTSVTENRNRALTIIENISGIEGKREESPLSHRN